MKGIRKNNILNDVDTVVRTRDTGLHQERQCRKQVMARASIANVNKVTITGVTGYLGVRSANFFACVCPYKDESS